MSSAVDILAKRVGEAAEMIVSLRTKVQHLEHELMTTHPMDHSPPAQTQPLPQSDPSLVEELERLRSERIEIRESIRGLLREIDRVSW